MNLQSLTHTNTTTLSNNICRENKVFPVYSADKSDIFCNFVVQFSEEIYGYRYYYVFWHLEYYIFLGVIYVHTAQVSYNFDLNEEKS